MTKFTKSLAVALIALSAPFATGMTTQSEARTVSLSSLQSEGFRSCKAIPRGYTAVVRGTLSIPVNYRGTNKFSVRYCFTSEAQCVRFASSIRNIIHNVDYVRTARCNIR